MISDPRNTLFKAVKDQIYYKDMSISDPYRKVK